MHVAIIGKKFSQQIEYFEEMGHTYVIFKDTAKRLKPNDNTIYADYGQIENLYNALDKSNLSKKFDACMTVYEPYVKYCALACRRLGLPGLTPEAAEACTDKELMRGLFAKAPRKISPGFRAITTWDEAKDFAATHSFPIMLKPANLAKSILVTKNHNIQELKTNFDRMVETIGEIYKKYNPHTRPKMIIEEFMLGPIYSVDAFIGADGVPQVLEQVVDYQTGYDIGYEDNFHYSRIIPTKLSIEERDALRDCAAMGVKALGITSSPAHVEIIRTAEGPMIVEIGARNGGYRERMHGLANGIDIIGNALAVASGQPTNTDSTKDDSCAVLELFPKNSGTYAGLQNETQLKALPSLNYLGIKAKPGQYIGKSADGHKAAAIIILHHNDAKIFENDLAFVTNEVYVQTA